MLIDTHLWVLGTATNGFQDSCFPRICSANDKNPESSAHSTKSLVAVARHVVIKINIGDANGV
jgi:hypothetical protein